MSTFSPPSATEYRCQMIQLVQVVRTPSESDRAYERSARPVRNWVCQHERGARRMREPGLPKVRRRRGTRTTRVDRSRRAAPDWVERQSRTDAPNRIRVAETIYVPTWTRFVYLAIVLDVFSRKVMESAIVNHLRTELLLGKPDIAIGQRRPEPKDLGATTQRLLRRGTRANFYEVLWL